MYFSLYDRINCAKGLAYLLFILGRDSIFLLIVLHFTLFCMTRVYVGWVTDLDKNKCLLAEHEFGSYNEGVPDLRDAQDGQRCTDNKEWHIPGITHYQVLPLLSIRIRSRVVRYDITWELHCCTPEYHLVPT